MSKSNKMRVVLVEPGRYTRKATIENTLEAEQAVVGGMIDVIRPGPRKTSALSSMMKGRSSHCSRTGVCPKSMMWCTAPFSFAVRMARILQPDQ